MEKIKCAWSTGNQFVKNNLMLVLIVLLGTWWLWGGGDEHSIYRQSWNNTKGEMAMDMDDGMRVQEEMVMSKSMSYGGRGMDIATSIGVPPMAYADFEPNIEDRKIIKNASLTIEASDTESARERTETRIKEMGGAITNMNSWEARPGVLAYNFTIRIPAEKLEESMQKLVELGVKKSENFSTSDITAQYMDTANRLKNLEVRRDRLREMMDRKTENLADVLSIDRELSNVQSQIENYEQTQKNRDTDVAYSTLNLTINPETQIGDFTNPNWNVTKSWRTSVNDLIHSLQGLLDRVIKIVVFIPIWVPILFLAWWGRKKWRNKRK